MSRTRYPLLAALALIVTLVGGPAANAASFGTLNFFYAPSNVITPLPGYTTSWSGSSFSTTSADYFVSQRVPWTIAQGGTGTTTGGVTNGIVFYNGSYHTNNSALTTDGSGNIYSGIGSPQFVYGATSTVGTSIWGVVNPTIAKPLFYTTTTGGLVIPSTSSNAFVVGPNGTSSPAIQVDDSVSSAANGLLFQPQVDGGSFVVQAQGPGSNNGIKIASTGTGITRLDTLSTSGQSGLYVNGAVRVTAGSTNVAISNDHLTFNDIATTQASARALFTNAADTNLATSTGAIFFEINNAANSRTWGGGTVALQSDIQFTGGVHAFAWYNIGQNIFTQLNNVEIDYPAVNVGGNGTTTNNAALYIPTRALNASTTNATGLQIQAPTGATNNYAASTTGRFVMSGLTNDSSDVGTLCETSAGEVVLHTTAGCITSSKRFKTDIAPLDNATNLSEALAMRPVSYLYKPGNGPSGPQVGFIAEEMVNVDSRLVPLDSQGLPFTVNYQQLTAVLDGAIQEIEAQVTALLTHQSQQDMEITQLQAEVAALQKGRAQDECVKR